MKPILLLSVLATALLSSSAASDTNDATSKEILTIERKALDGWLAGNPDPMLAAMDPDVTYFHVVSDKRVEGLPAVKALFEPYRGRPLYDSYELTDPKLQVGGDTVILTYVLVSHSGNSATRWNGTQVYQHKKDGWRVIHTHWSQIAER